MSSTYRVFCLFCSRSSCTTEYW